MPTCLFTSDFDCSVLQSLTRSTASIPVFVFHKQVIRLVLKTWPIEFCIGSREYSETMEGRRCREVDELQSRDIRSPVHLRTLKLLIYLAKPLGMNST